MIFDNILNVEKYKNNNELYEELKKLSLMKIRGSVDDKLTKTIELNEAKFENHKKYIDIHFVIKGKEKILVSNRINELVRLTEYDDNNDFELFELNDDYSILMLNQGDFLIVYPGEPHSPKISVDGKNVYKTVMKIKYGD